MDRELREEIVHINYPAIVGILTYASSENRKLPTILLINAGLIHRVGPNRTYVKLARKLALEGYNVYRFDYGGLGDSFMPPGQNDMSQYIDNTFRILEKKLDINQFVLMGMCTGAEVAFNIALLDNRVKGIVMINGSGLPAEKSSKLYEESSRQIKARYYKKALMEPNKWLKLIKGKSKLFNTRNIKASFRWIFRKTLRFSKKNNRFEGPIPYETLKCKKIQFLVIISEGSTVYDMVKIICGDRYEFDHFIMANVDHTVTPVWAQNDMHSKIISWCNTTFKKITY